MEVRYSGAEGANDNEEQAQIVPFLLNFLLLWPKPAAHKVTTYSVPKYLITLTEQESHLPEEEFGLWLLFPKRESFPIVL